MAKSRGSVGGSKCNVVVAVERAVVSVSMLVLLSFLAKVWRERVAEAAAVAEGGLGGMINDDPGIYGVWWLGHDWCGDGGRVLWWCGRWCNSNGCDGWPAVTEGDGFRTRVGNPGVGWW